jgi:hypothetical protein
VPRAQPIEEKAILFDCLPRQALRTGFDKLSMVGFGVEAIQISAASL